MAARSAVVLNFVKDMQLLCFVEFSVGTISKNESSLPGSASKAVVLILIPERDTLKNCLSCP